MENIVNRISDNIKEKYSSLGFTICPFLEQQVFFNNKGFKHLLYKSGNRKRDYSETLERSGYLGLAKEILSKTTTLQEKETLVSENKTVYYFGFIAIVENIKLKVVVRKDNINGKYYFYSVIPHFITSLKRDSAK